MENSYIAFREVFLICIFVIVILFDNSMANLRQKRFLTFPRTSPTRVQVKEIC